MSFDPTKVKMTPVDELPTEKGKKKKPEKAKPEKRKLKYSKNRYAKFPPTSVINKTVVNTVNTRMLANKKDKMKLTDTEIGEATMYLVEYYTELDIEHPVLVLFGAVMATGLKVAELSNQPDIRRIE